jgi:RimJ/RimL family protein N-acetyltransferase
VRLFCDERFMVFSGVLDAEGANRRFDEMLQRAAELPFAKQPVIERATGSMVGYSGVDVFEFEGQRRLEFGYRLVPGARGQGYATEAGLALLSLAEETFVGEILAMIDPRNAQSQNVARKLGFAFWKQAVVNGYLDNLYRLQVGSANYS